jgi:hypothetical protein
MRSTGELPDLLPPRCKETPLWRRAIYFGAGIILILMGFVGWIIPVITGIPFYVAGLVLLGMASTRFCGWFNRLERKLPYKLRVMLRRALLKIPSKKLREHLQGPAVKEPQPTGVSSPS